MITTRFYLDSRATDAEKASPLKLCLVRQGKSAYIQMDIRLFPNQWNKKEQKVVEHPNKRALNSYLETRKTQIDNTIRELILSGKLKNLTITQIKKKVLEVIDPQVDSSNLFYARLTAYAAAAKAQRTKEIYTSTAKHILLFDSKARTLGFDDITKTWLERFDAYLMKTTPSRNARNIHFRNIRTVFNAAIDDEIIPASTYPFRKFKIRDEETRKRNLTREQMKYLLSLEVKPHQRKYLDCFLLSFYLSGINGVDLLNAKKEQVVNGRLEYKRSKTGRLMSVKIEPEAAELLSKYEGRELLVKWGEHRKSYKSFMMKVDQAMSEIIKGCTAYHARHTIASLADELDIPEGIIGRILGHKDKAHETTMIYINPLQSKADKACRKIFDYIKD